MSIHQDDIVGVGGRLDPETLIRAYRRGHLPLARRGAAAPLVLPARAGDSRLLPRARQPEPRAGAAAERAPLQRRRRVRGGDPRLRGHAAAGPGRHLDHRRDRRRRTRACTRSASPTASRRGAGADLVAGVYGVAVDGAFAAESMFHRESNASKLVLLHLIDHLAAAGLDWIDIQVMTPHLERLGAHVVSRGQFLARLTRTRARGLTLF